MVDPEARKRSLSTKNSKEFLFFFVFLMICLLYVCQCTGGFFVPDKLLVESVLLRRFS